MSRGSVKSYGRNGSQTDLRPSLLQVEVLEPSSTGPGWERRGTTIEEILDDGRDRPTFVFASSNSLKGVDLSVLELRRRLENYYGMPNHIWSNTQWESNGFFGCAGDERVRHKTWFRFLVKVVRLASEHSKSTKPTALVHTPDSYDYVWHQMGFFSTWSPKGQRSILCLDCPPDIINHIHNSLVHTSGETFEVDPYCFHPHIVGGVVITFDTSIWLLRDLIRHTEKNRPTISMKAEFDYLLDLHELSRHVVHYTEILTVATEIMSKMVNRHGGFVSRMNSSPEQEQESMMQVDDNLDYYQGLLFGFKCRCESMVQRHQSEISLAQSHAVAVDAAAMKAIAGLTIVFLPATFVSAIFSMSFFDNGEQWGLSPKIWIYWVIAIPVTLITVVLLRRGPRGSIMRFLTF
ncbi:hypothetical protein TWF281_002637 [Arthrobotrys megalospora]